jgi:CHAT domain-containing protein
LSARIAVLRTTIEPEETSSRPVLPVYDVQEAHALYKALIGPISAETAQLKRLVIVPNGPLVALPLEVLVTDETDPVTDQNYSKVPFLVQKLAISYIPSAQNLVVLRKKTQTSNAPEGSYIGFGNFKPASVSQLEQSFPPGRCGNDLEGLKNLQLLPGTQKEVTYIGHSLYNAPPQDIVLGSAFTKATIQATDFSRFRVVHFATHALLPTDLSCRPEPTIIVSADPKAANAESAFLGVDDILSLKLDANLVVLSACNTGPSGKTTGDSLSGLARSFFFAGARGLLATHWALEDTTGPVLTALTLQSTSKGLDPVESLQQAKLELINVISRQAGGNSFTHPFAWAPFVLIGDGETSKSPAS